MPELNIPQGKTFCANFVTSVNSPSQCSQIKHDPEQGQIQIKFESNSNTFMDNFKA